MRSLNPRPPILRFYLLLDYLGLSQKIIFFVRSLLDLRFCVFIFATPVVKSKNQIFQILSCDISKTASWITEHTYEICFSKFGKLSPYCAKKNFKNRKISEIRQKSCYFYSCWLNFQYFQISKACSVIQRRVFWYITWQYLKNVIFLLYYRGCENKNAKSEV